MFQYLRRRAVAAGFLGDSKLWFRIGVVVWSLHLLRRVMGNKPKTVFEAELEPGETIIVSDLRPIEAKGPGKSVKLDV
ncbi:MAG: hypothetical protein JWP02_1902 [Acidimicrobiales bacterium]|jgi:hypothetical protein|nr:hypothetical protein [Acidimicrobiales bacterium]